MVENRLETTRDVEGRIVEYAECPISFEAFLQLSECVDADLIDGVMVERMAAQLDHERLYAWLFPLLNYYVIEKELGIVLGSRTAVKIDDYGGRLPDLLFVRQERMEIVHQKAIYGAPDLVIEIASPNDRPSDLIALEADYRRLGVAEMWFIEPSKRRVRVLHKRPEDYETVELREGTLSSEAVIGFALQVEWLFEDPRPNGLKTLTTLLHSASEE